MYRLIALATLALCALAQSWGANLSPEEAVSLDFRWLSRPVIAPENAWGDVIWKPEHIRLVSRPAAAGPSFSWSLRYPINIQEYPVLVLRYRAARIGNTAEPVVAVEASQGDRPLGIVSAGELVQGAAVQEIRKDLRWLGAGSELARLRFALPSALARLDVMEVRFEPARGRNAAAPVRQTFEVSVIDERDRPVPRATVLAGLLERANWVAAGESDADGRVVLAVPLPGEFGEETKRPDREEGAEATPELAPRVKTTQEIEAAITAPGYAPRYFASIRALPNTVFVVRLSREGEYAEYESDRPGEADERDGVTNGFYNGIPGRFGASPNATWGATSPAGAGMFSAGSREPVLSVPTKEIKPIGPRLTPPGRSIHSP